MVITRDFSWLYSVSWISIEAQCRHNFAVFVETSALSLNRDRRPSADNYSCIMTHHAAASNDQSSTISASQSVDGRWVPAVIWWNCSGQFSVHFSHSVCLCVWRESVCVCVRNNSSGSDGYNWSKHRQSSGAILAQNLIGSRISHYYCACAWDSGNRLELWSRDDQVLGPISLHTKCFVWKWCVENVRTFLCAKNENKLQNALFCPCFSILCIVYRA